ncbi:MAG TPA: phosphoribosylanthranilate isomerase [Gemmatimonadaceae bacterium]|nr:phosphoribosylanthranilate isomerase [Gemmatimonadaceae bacterium]
MSQRSVRVKICCMQSPAEARIAIAAGADALGLVSRMPSGPGPISDASIAEIVATIPDRVATFLLTSRTTVPEITRQQQRCGANTLQLVDRVSPGARRKLRAALPNVSIVQVVHVCDEAAIAEAVDVSSDSDAILLDSGNPSLAVKELGGTGRAHDWEISRAIREAVSVPVWLAGGLNAGNVAAAIRQVAPFGVDVCSGVRTAGNLDETKLTAFMNALAAA